MNSKQFKLAAALLACISANGVLAQAPSCDDKCLTDIAKAYLRDVAKQDSSKLPWADKVRYTENNVAMMIGDGFWGAGPGINDGGLFLTDPATGNVLWYGISTEHEQPAYHGLRLKITNKQISEVESLLGRKEEPEVFAATDGFKVDPVWTSKLAANARRTREQLVALVDGYYNTKVQNHGQVLTAFASDCVQVTNGVSLTSGDAYWAAKAVQGCEAQMKAGVYKPVERIRGRRYPLVNVDTGVVVALSLEDHAARFLDYTTVEGKPLTVQFGYPNTRGRLDLFKIDDGKIKRIEGISVFLPYYIRSLWND